MIELIAVSKQYRLKKKMFSLKQEYKRGVDNLNFTINDGEIVGYLGPNGAGKSTTIKLLLGIMQPDTGTIKYDGREINTINKNELLKKIGIVFGQKTQLWWDLPLTRTFEVIKILYDIEDEVFNERLDYFVERLELEEIMDSPVRSLSLGQRVKADIVAALIYNPKIIYFDEALNGVDTKSVNAIISFLKDVNEKYNTTIIYTSHNLNTVEKLCDKLILIEKGTILFVGSISEYKKIHPVDYEATFIFDKKIDVNFDIEYSHEIDDNELKIFYSSSEIKFLDLIGKIIVPDNLELVNVENKEIELERFLLNEI